MSKLALTFVLLLALPAFALPSAGATPPGCNPGPLPGTCCPPTADCACLLCNVGLACPTETVGNWAVGVTITGCTQVSAYVCTQATYMGGGAGGPANDFTCRSAISIVLP